MLSRQKCLAQKFQGLKWVCNLVQQLLICRWRRYVNNFTCVSERHVIYVVWSYYTTLLYATVLFLDMDVCLHSGCGHIYAQSNKQKEPSKHRLGLYLRNTGQVFYC